MEMTTANRFGLDEGFRGPVYITGLPAELAEVPPDPTGPDDPDRFAKRRAWEEWSFKIRVLRLDILKDCLANKDLRAIEMWKCRDDPAYFLTMFGYIHEPRASRRGQGFSPWVPFARQVQMIRWYQWVRAQDDENADGLDSKCRDMGATWVMCALFTHGWLFETTFNALVVSWKEDYVDSRKPRAVFKKIDWFMQHLPDWMLPDGYIPKPGTKHRIHLLIENPSNTNTITGEATTTNSGRGDRATVMLFDEAAQIPGLMDVWMGVTDSTDHRFGVSTESLDQGTDWVDLRSGAGAEYSPSVFIMEWYENPLHDDAWYERQEKRFAADPDQFQQEVLRNPYRNSQFVYPKFRDKFPLDDIAYEHGNPLYVAIDPGFDDATAIIWIQYNVAKSRYEVLDGYTNDKQITDFYGPILAGSKLDTNGVAVDGDWVYTDYEENFITWVGSIGGVKAKFIGDTYGNNRNGASADSWYTVWLRNHGIRVNRDRTPSGQLMAAKNQARQMDGRRKAVRWISQNVVFSNTIGARKALLALQNNQFEGGNNDKIRERGMKRDGTTHFTSAFEYWAANMYMQDLLLGYNEIQQERRELNKLKTLAPGTRYRRSA